MNRYNIKFELILIYKYMKVSLRPLTEHQKQMFEQISFPNAFQDPLWAHKPAADSVKSVMCSMVVPYVFPMTTENLLAAA